MTFSRTDPFKKEAGVFATVSGLVDQFSDNPAANMTAQEFAESVRRWGEDAARKAMAGV
jgi:hypothetical protein